MLDDSKDFVCVTALSSFYSLAAGNALTGIFYAFAIVFGVLGSKRFTNSFSAKMKEFKEYGMTTIGRGRGGGGGARRGEARSRRKTYASELDRYDM